jgi:superfamily II DNA/RNA helicase
LTALNAAPAPVSETPQTLFADLGLPWQLVSALAQEGITEPFPIQSAAIPDALAGLDVLGRGQTGSGKTLAFGLPLIVRVAGERRAAEGQNAGNGGQAHGNRRAASKHPRGLVLVPTRELAMQVKDALEPLGRRMNVRVRLVVGGMPIGKQLDGLRRGAEVVVATPGRLLDVIRRDGCSLADIQVTVLDEADHMADLGFMPDVRALLDQVPVEGQRMLFSATLDKDVDVLVQRYLTDPRTHSVAPEASPVEGMDHHLFLVDRAEKAAVITEIANREGRTIMFVRTKHAVDALSKRLARNGVRAGSLHGGKTQSARTRTLTDFREGRVGVLIATNVAARGIHVDDVSLVVHVDPAGDHKDYLHRAGRTARAGQRGTVVTLALPSESRGTERMIKRAGVAAVARSRVEAGHSELVRVTGARRPSGIPIEPEPERPARPERHAHRSARPQGGRRYRFDNHENADSTVAGGDGLARRPRRVRPSRPAAR